MDRHQSFDPVAMYPQCHPPLYYQPRMLFVVLPSLSLESQYIDLTLFKEIECLEAPANQEGEVLISTSLTNSEGALTSTSPFPTYLFLFSFFHRFFLFLLFFLSCSSQGPWEWLSGVLRELAVQSPVCPPLPRNVPFFPFILLQM